MYVVANNQLEQKLLPKSLQLLVNKVVNHSMMCYINVMKWHVIHFNKSTDRQHDNMMNHTIQWYHIGAP
jgi:hypothetical protein